jgi:acetyl esterase/lipase
MAELTTTITETNTNACCAPDAQASCCEPSAKAECCDPNHVAGCGCSAGKSPEAA